MHYIMRFTFCQSEYLPHPNTDLCSLPIDAQEHLFYIHFMKDIYAIEMWTDYAAIITFSGTEYRSAVSDDAQLESVAWMHQSQPGMPALLYVPS